MLYFFNLGLLFNYIAPHFLENTFATINEFEAFGIQSFLLLESLDPIHLLSPFSPFFALNLKPL
jgi:hypothetical protein